MTTDHRQEWQALRRAVARNIHEHRIRKHWTLHKLARRSGISLKRLDIYESGKSEMNLLMIARIAAALEIETLALMQHHRSSRHASP